MLRMCQRVIASVPRSSPAVIGCTRPRSVSIGLTSRRTRGDSRRHATYEIRNDLQRGSVKSDHDFTRVKRLSPTVGRITLDSANTHDALERTRSKPASRTLRSEMMHQQLDLPVRLGARERNVHVRRPEIPFIFRNFVFEDQMITKGVPRELAHDSVILMEIP